MILWAAAAGLTTGEAVGGCSIGGAWQKISIDSCVHVPAFINIDSGFLLVASDCQITQGLAAMGWLCLLICKPSCRWMSPLLTASDTFIQQWDGTSPYLCSL